MTDLARPSGSPRHLSRQTGTALWRQIAERLESAIAAGQYPPGAQLPTEHRLAAEFSVNRHTVRHAIAALAESGLVRIEQGRGSFVQEHVVDYWIKTRTRFSENVQNARQEPSGRSLDLREEPADDAAAKALELRRGTQVWVIERLSEANGRPLSLTTHYFPKARFPALASIYGEIGTISATLDRLGVGDYTRKITRVTARLARAIDTKLLQQAPTKPVLVTEAINIDGEGRPIEYSIGHWASDRVQMVFEPGK
jgi:GntR family phosphonate transport system transcriptional regulator